MLNLILGKAKSGKSYELFKQINNDINMGLMPMVIVPTRLAKDSLTKKLARERGGFIGKLFFTLAEVVSSIIENSDFARANDISTISDFEAYILVKLIIEENKNNLLYFKNIDEYGGVVDLIYSIITELRAGIVLNSDSDMFSTFEADDDKWKDINFIYRQYEMRLNDKMLHDSYWMYKQAADILGKENNLNIEEYSSLYIDGFFDFTNSQYNFIKSLIYFFHKSDKPVSIALLKVEFSIINDTLRQFKADFKCNIEKPDNTSEVADIATSLILFDKSIEVPEKLNNTEIVEINAFGKYREVELVANEIKRLVNEENHTYNDIAVIARNSEAYAKHIGNIFGSFEIPYFHSKDEALKDNPAIIYLYSIIKHSIEKIDNIGIISLANSNYTGNNNIKKLIAIGKHFSEYIKGNNIRWEISVDNKICSLDKRIHNIKRYDFTAEHSDNNPDVESIESLIAQKNELLKLQPILAKMLATIFKLKPNKSYTPSEFILWIAEIITFFEMKKSISHSSANDVFATRDFIAFRKLKEVLNNLNRSLRIFGKEKFQFTELFTIFDHIVQRVRYRYQYYQGLSVKILTPFDARETEFKTVFIVGLNEAEFPGKLPISIVDNSERINLNKLSKQTILHDDEKIMNTERLDFYISFTRATDKIYLCSTPYDESGAQILPSIFLSAIRNHFDNSYPHIPAIKADETDDDFSQDIFSIVPSQEWIDIHSLQLLLSNNFNLLSPKTNYKLMWINDFVKRVGDMRQYYSDVISANSYFDSENSKTAMFAVMGSINNESKKYTQKKIDNIKFSASSLEKAGNCRYEFFFKYILGVREDKYPTEEIELRWEGSFYHEVLKNYLEATKNKSTDELPDFTELNRAIDNTFADMSKKEGDEKLLRLEIEHYRNVLKEFIVFEKNELRNDFIPIEFEYHFEDKELSISEDKKITYHGSIDRVGENNGNYRIIDYKSGAVKYYAESIGIPLKLFQGFIYAKAYDKYITEISYVSIKKCEKTDVLPFGKTIVDFANIWEQKHNEICLLFELLYSGNFLPYTTADDFQDNKDLLTIYTRIKKDGNFDFESKSKCKFCAYKEACLRADKKITDY